MSPHAEPPEPPYEDMGPITPATVSLRILITALAGSMTPKQARAFLREMARLHAEEDAMANVMALRPVSQHPAVRKSRKQARAWFESVLPTFLAAVRRD